MLTLEIVSTSARFNALREEWNALAESFGTPLLRHEWFVACLAGFGGDRQLAVFTAWEDGRLRAAAPLLVSNFAGSALSFLGLETTEPGGFLYADQRALDFLADALLDRRLPLVLPRLKADGSELQALRAQTGRRGVWLLRAGNTATATVPLACDFATFEARMTSEERRQMRRRYRRAEREGALSFEITSPADCDLAVRLREIYEVEASGWKRQAGTAILCDARIERFCNSLASWAAKAGILRLAVMRIGGKAAAGGILLEYTGRLWGLKQGYDERWAPCAPSILLAHECIRYACGKGLAAYEFLGNAEKFQMRWPLAITPYSRLRYYPFSLRGVAAGAADACRMPFNRWHWRRRGHDRASAALQR